MLGDVKETTHYSENCDGKVSIISPGISIQTVFHN